MLRDFFERERTAGRPCVAAIVVATEGSTYRKPGALMLFSETGERSGLLSGGCLEGDLGEHAAALLRSDTRCIVKSYDSRGSDDPVWGLGLGCEGLMQILLLRVDAASRWEPLSSIFTAQSARQEKSLGINIDSGEIISVSDAPSALSGRVFTLSAERRPALLLCGAGPDAEPVAALAVSLGWQVTIVDHRPAYVVPSRFKEAVRLMQIDITRPESTITLDDYDAAVVMSHHLIADGRYLAMLAKMKVPYVGLLGPAARRERLIAELGSDAHLLRPRLRAPVGLDLGGRTPEEIALSIVAEIQATLNGRSGAPFSARR